MLAYESQHKQPLILLEYLDLIIRNGNRDRVIHNYYFYLLCRSPSPQPQERILEFIEMQSVDVIFDIQYAIRLATRFNLIQARVKLLLLLSLSQQALDLALLVL